MTTTADPDRLRREWALCAIAAAGSRFVPVPLLDDLIKDRATRTAVDRTWRAHGRPATPRVIDVLSGESGGWAGDVARAVARLPVTVVLYPWRKAVRVATAVQGVSGDLVRVLLLARTVDRSLTSGRFAGSDPKAWEDEARRVRRAHDAATAGLDLRVLEHAMGAALRQVKGLRQQAEVFARRRFGRAGGTPSADGTTGAGAGVDDAMSPGTDPDDAAAGDRVVAGARVIESVLAQPEVVALLATLDARFDAAIASDGRHGGMLGRIRR
jgi:hypothetical protein